MGEEGGGNLCSKHKKWKQSTKKGEVQGDKINKMAPSSME